MAGCCCAEECTAAVLIGVMLLPGCPFDSAWCLACEVCRLSVDWVDCRCFLSFVLLGGARHLELSPCNTWLDKVAGIGIESVDPVARLRPSPLCVLRLQMLRHPFSQPSREEWQQSQVVSGERLASTESSLGASVRLDGK